MAQTDVDELPRRRWWLKPLIAMALLAFLAVGGAAAYRRFEPARLAANGRGHLAKEDYRNAVLCAQRALQINPLSEPAVRLMVDIAERLNSPAALDWRQQLVEMHREPADAFGLAASALRHGKPVVARKALEAVPEADRASAPFHASAGLVALQEGRVEAAEMHFGEAAKLEPASELHQCNLATLRIQSGDPKKRQAGAEALADLAKGGRLQLQALRGLVTRLGRDQKLDEAIQRSSVLINNPAAEFRDHIVHVALLQRAKSAEFPAALTAAQKLAAADADRAAQLVNWMLLHGLVNEALQWSAQLEAAVRASGPIAAARAECFAEAKDWDGLKRLTSEGNWGPWEFLRHAWESRARRELLDSALAAPAWQSALNAAQKRRDDLQRLAAHTLRWDWKEESRETLWVGAHAAAPQWALQLLHRSYLADQDTENLLRVARRMLQVDPTSDAARNNVAMLSLLLNVDLAESLEAAKALNAKTPENADFAATYALALHLHGRTAEGLGVLRRLKTDQLQSPAIAAYYGLLLFAAGEKAEAEKFREIGLKAALLPEEKALLQRSAAPPA